MDISSFNLDSAFQATARRQPQAAAVLGPGVGDETTYADLDRAVDAAADALAAAGVGPRDCIGLHAPSGKDYIVLTYAAWRRGACVVPIPVELVDPEKRQIIERIKVDAVITPSGGGVFAAPLQRDAAKPLVPGVELLPVASPRVHPPGFAALDAAFIRFTSGTTGTSKGVVLSHRSITERITAADDVLKIGPSDRVLWLLSMSYHFAVSIAGYLRSGAAIILPKNHLAQEVLAAGRRWQATILYASPTHIGWLADATGTQGLDRLRLALATTAALDRQTAQAFHRRFGVPVSQALGIIEVGLPFINVDAAAEAPDAVGRPLPAYQVKLEDNGLGPQFRDVLVRGPGCLDAYYDPWRTRSEIMPDGWFRTGDVGEIDESGRLFLHGRAKDVINVMGMKFFPQEVESVLTAHPDVAEACVLPARDARLGEVPVARVVLQGDEGHPPTEQSLLDFCRRRMATYKVPLHIEFVQKLAKTASGKVLHQRDLTVM